MPPIDVLTDYNYVTMCVLTDCVHTVAWEWTGGGGGGDVTLHVRILGQGGIHYCTYVF